VSGPAVKYMRALGLENSSFGVAKYYREFVGTFIISKEDGSTELQRKINALDMQVYKTNIIMKARRDEIRLGSYLLKLIERKMDS
jgi:LPPG:FO 2-phospho-L-lactate transferase